jgi:hypothetical protein
MNNNNKENASMSNPSSIYVTAINVVSTPALLSNKKIAPTLDHDERLMDVNNNTNNTGRNTSTTTTMGGGYQYGGNSSNNTFDSIEDDDIQSTDDSIVCMC